jgi:predicted transcriptional regulator
MTKTETVNEHSDEDWQVEEIKNALEEADHGEFASTRDVARTFRKWTRRST